MTEPQEFSSDFDLWVCSLLDLLRTRYYNVSVNRGHDEYVFNFSYSIHEWGKGFSEKKDEKRISKTTLDEHFQNKQTPQQILELIK